MITLNELLEHPKSIKKLELSNPEQVTSDGLFQRTVSDGWQPTDKYYAQMGDEIEERPIATPGLRRG